MCVLGYFKFFIVQVIHTQTFTQIFIHTHTHRFSATDLGDQSGHSAHDWFRVVDNVSRSIFILAFISWLYQYCFVCSCIGYLLYIIGGQCNWRFLAYQLVSLHLLLVLSWQFSQSSSIILATSGGKGNFVVIIFVVTHQHQIISQLAKQQFIQLLCILASKSKHWRVSATAQCCGYFNHHHQIDKSLYLFLNFELICDYPLAIFQ